MTDIFIQDLIPLFKKWKIREEKEIAKIEKILKAISTPQNNEEEEKEKILKAISTPQNNEEEEKEEIEAEKLDVNDPNNLNYFWKSCKKKDNDKTNKYRESIIKKIVNDNDFYKIYQNHKYEERISSLVQRLKREIARYTKKEYKSINVEIKAGRKYNYDFLLKYLNKDEETVDEIKVEFKYGVTTLTEYPEIYSKYTKGASIFHNKDYIKYFYEKLDDFIETFPDEISEKLKKHKPSLIKYKKIINDAKYKHPFQNIIYKYDKQMKDKKNLKHKRFVNDTIKDFLKSITENDINFEEWRKELVSKQKGKHFLLCKDGIWYTERLTKEILITNKWKIQNGNMIVFDCENPQYQLKCLLRWKNHKGCAGPAWQVKLHKI